MGGVRGVWGGGRVHPSGAADQSPRGSPGRTISEAGGNLNSSLSQETRAEVRGEGVIVAVSNPGEGQPRL